MDHPKLLLLIPARGGSKSIPKKNLVDLGGQPLISHAIEAALACHLPMTVAVSSDDPEILAVAKSWGVTTLIDRPSYLATDEATSVDVALHAHQELGSIHDYIALLQPTAPFVQAIDIDGCIELALRNNAPSAVTITNASVNPHWCFSMTNEGRLKSFLPGPRIIRRQDAPPAYCLNGAVFVSTADFLRTHKDFVGPGTLGYEMPIERSVDIDEPHDLEYARDMFKKIHN